MYARVDSTLAPLTRLVEGADGQLYGSAGSSLLVVALDGTVSFRAAVGFVPGILAPDGMLYALGIDDSRPVAVLSRLASEGIEARLRIAVPDYLPGNLIDGRDGSFYFFGTTPFYSGAAYDVALYRVSWPGPAAPRGLRIPR